MAWLRAWRSDPVVLRSPLPVESVRARLIEGSISELRDNFVLGVGEYRVVGRVFGLWLGVGSWVFLGLVVRAVVMAIGGDATGEDFLICLIPLGFVLGPIASTAKGGQVDRSEVSYFQSWLADRLQASVGIPGHRSWQEDTPR